MKKNYFLFVLASVLLLTFQNANAQCAAAQTGDYPVEGTFGDNEWVAYAYNSTNTNYNTTNYDFSDYRGYYVDAGYGQDGSSFDSNLSWSVGESPSSAANYIGCSVNYNYHNISYRRRGFDSGTYQINLDAMTSGQQQGYNDQVKLIIDGVQVWSSSTCCQYAGNVWTGTLDENSEVELQSTEQTNNSFARLQLVKQVTENSFGDGEWHVACYSGVNFDTYFGSYTQAALSFDSRDLWEETTYPSQAWSYSGTAFTSDNLSYIYKRTGFDCGNYTIDVPRHDDDTEIIVDGTVVSNLPGYTYAGISGVWTGDLDTNSEVEIRVKNNGLYNTSLAVDFIYNSGAATGTYATEGEFGDNEWVAYCYSYPNGDYNSTTFDFTDYRGYYIDAGYGTAGISFDSEDSWLTNENPSNATNYIGCSLNNDFHNVIYKRKGFPVAANYVISVEGLNGEQGHDDAAKLFIDGVEVWSNTGCCTAASGVWNGPLDADSEIIFQWSENGGASYGRLNIEEAPVEDTSFGSGEWKVACYNGNNFQSYAGNYTHSVLSFDSSDLWSQDTNPSNASTYSGIAISNDNHSYVYRREGFDCGYYNIDIARHDDDIEFVIDGVTVFQRTGWDNNNGQPDIWEGYLDENSQIEIHLREYGGGSILAVDFNYIFGPSNTGEYVWTGEISANPTQAGNWCGGVPINDGTSSILIREDAPNFPYYGAVANLNNMILEQNAEATLVAGTVLNIYGNLENNGAINTTDIELSFLGSSAQTFSGHGIEVDNFTLNNTNGLTLALDTDEVLTVQDVLTVTNGTLTTNDQVLLACNFVDPDRRTAQIADLTNGDISGLVTVEQCFPGRRAFRLVSPSVTTSTTIRENWQENQNNTGTNFPTDNQNSNDGYGTHITGSQSGANGFDATPSGNPSMYMFSNANQNWSAVANTNATTLTAGAPYRLMIRGSRAINVTSNSAGVSNTILSTEGAVQKGDIDQNTFNSTAGSYNFFGNPYHAAIDLSGLFADISTTNVNTNFYYIWDPTLGGTPTPGQPGGRGAFVAIDLSDGSNASGSDANEFLQPMQAGFFVTANAGTTPNLHFSESIKAVTADQTSVMRNANLNAKSIGIKLYNEVSYLNGDTPSDGLKIKFASDGDNAFDMKDAPKYGNLDENLARNISNTHYLALESRNLPVAGEILPLFINQYRTENYVFEIDVENINEVEVFLKDNYLNELTPLSTGVNQVSFIIDQDVEASVAFDRFELRFAESNLGAEDFNQNQLVVYPNPIKGNELQIRLGEMSSEVDVMLFDMLGKQVYRSVQQPTQEVVSLTDLDLANGIYILKVQTAEGKLFTQKIVKE